MTVVDTDTAKPAKPKAATKPKASQAVALPNVAALAASPSNDPPSMLARAIEKGMTGADLKELMDLQERWSANQARKDFDIAMAQAQAEMPTIVKNRLVYFEAKNGGKDTSYRHEDLAGIVETIRPILHKHGLAHRFRTEQKVIDGSMVITVTCLITGHGHREETPLSSGPDQNGSGMNNLQRIASTVTYLERYTLKAALGLAASVDDDGRGGPEPTGEFITAAQLAQLEALAKEVGADVTKACKHLKIDSLAALPAARFEKAMASLEAKRVPL